MKSWKKKMKSFICQKFHQKMQLRYRTIWKYLCSLQGQKNAYFKLFERCKPNTIQTLSGYSTISDHSQQSSLNQNLLISLAQSVGSWYYFVTKNVIENENRARQKQHPFFLCLDQPIASKLNRVSFPILFQNWIADSTEQNYVLRL